MMRLMPYSAIIILRQLLKKDAGGMWTCVNEGTPTITTIDSTK